MPPCFDLQLRFPRPPFPTSDTVSVSAHPEDAVSLPRPTFPHFLLVWHTRSALNIRLGTCLLVKCLSLLSWASVMCVLLYCGSELDVPVEPPRLQPLFKERNMCAPLYSKHLQYVVPNTKSFLRCSLVISFF